MSARRLSIDSKMTLQSLGNPGGVGGRAGTHPAAAPTIPVAPADPLAPAGLGDHDVAAWAAGPAAAELGVTGEPTGGGGSFEQDAASVAKMAGSARRRMTTSHYCPRGRRSSNRTGDALEPARERARERHEPRDPRRRLVRSRP